MKIGDILTLFETRQLNCNLMKKGSLSQYCVKIINSQKYFYKPLSKMKHHFVKNIKHSFKPNSLIQINLFIKFLKQIKRNNYKKDIIKHQNMSEKKN